jgi:hypothetical protein
MNAPWNIFKRRIANNLEAVNYQAGTHAKEFYRGNKGKAAKPQGEAAKHKTKFTVE